MGTYTRSEYHSRSPAWRRDFYKKGKYIGIEFECESNTHSYRDVLALLPNFSNGRAPITETDGSLSRDKGVEIVFPPVSYNFLKSSKSVVARALKAIEGGINKTSTAPGMHLNVNTYDWTEAKQLYFLATVHNLPRNMIKLLGGRYPNHYCALHPGESLEYYFDECMDDHSYAAEFKDGRIELRFPAALACHDHIKKLTLFVEQLENFVTTLPYDWRDSKYAEDSGALRGDFLTYLKQSKKGKQLYGILTNETASSTDTPTPAQPPVIQRQSIALTTDELPAGQALQFRSIAVLSSSELWEREYINYFAE